ncbi:uncharacterized protein [Typha latifolia]|uniref:uncharacterized protein n=1 Tax=Typha latifolia TaxID=4733 RepID=UPI003C2C33A1
MLHGIAMSALPLHPTLRPTRIIPSMRPPLSSLSPSPSPPSSSSSSSCSSSSPLVLPHRLSPFPSFSSSSCCALRPRRLHFFRTLSSLRETKKATLRKASNVPQNLKFDGRRGGGGGSNNEEEEEEEEEEKEADGGAALKGTVLAGLLLVGFVGGFGAVGYVYRDQINAFLTQFSGFIEGYGPAGYALFVLVYAGLEILAIPAIPLTMSAGLLFGSLIGTIIVSISGTVAATVAFLIARYFARERILKLVEGNKKFLAIDKAIGENGFRIVTLLRLSPLLPFSLGNYLYGLTSVKFVPYVLGSWLGMLPGTWAYVSAGAFGRAIIQEESDVGLTGGNGQLLTLGLGLLFTAIAAVYVTRLAKDAVKDME